MSVNVIEKRKGHRDPVNAKASHFKSGQADDVTARTRQSLKRLSRAIYEAVSELRGLGPYADREIAARTGSGVVTRLMALEESAHALLEQLRTVRADYLRAQVELLGVRGESRDLKLHIACGSRHVQGWINIDHYPAPLAMSALWDLPFADGSVTRVFVSRLPESLFFPIEIRRFLFEVRRVLESGGMVQIAVANPGVRAINGRATRELVYKEWALGLVHRTHLDYLLDASGADSDRAAARQTHRSVCSVDALMHMLVDERFTDIKSTECAEIERDDLRADPCFAVAGAVARSPGTSYIEACKPRH